MGEFFCRVIKGLSWVYKRKKTNIGGKDMGQLHLTMGFHIAGIIYLIVGLVALVGDHKNSNRILFFAICMLYTGWAVYSSLMNITPRPETALLFLEVRRLFVALIDPMTLLFLIRISGVAKERFQKISMQGLIFLPALFVILSRRMFPTPLDHVRVTKYGWTYEITSKAEVFNEIILMAYAVTIIFLLIYLFVSETDYKRKKQTYFVMLIAILIFEATHNFTNVMLRMNVIEPFDHIQNLPPLGVIMGVPQILIVYYFIQKNDFLNIDVNNLLCQFVDKIETGIIVENSEQKIIYKNEAVRKIFEDDGDEVILGLLAEIHRAKNSEKDLRISIQDEEGRARHMFVGFHRLEDRFGDYMGGVYNVEDSTELINSIIELEEAERTLKMQVEERTAELAAEIEIRKKSEEDLRFLAYNDSMTKLLNRRSLFEIAERNLHDSPDKTHAFIFMDINFFKTINDRYGHSEGDRMLITTANRLKEVYQGNAHVARFGGDEFVVFIEDTSREEVNQHIEKMYQRFEEDYKIMGLAHKISLSNGVALYPEDGENMDRLIKIADERMYDDKKRRKSNGEGAISRIRQRK